MTSRHPPRRRDHSRVSRLRFAGEADALVDSFLRFSKGAIISDERAAPGIEIGRPGESSGGCASPADFGRLTALVTDGRLPFPFGRTTYGYEVWDLAGDARRRPRRRARPCSSSLSRRTTEERRWSSFSRRLRCRDPRGFTAVDSVASPTRARLPTESRRP